MQGAPALAGDTPQREPPANTSECQAQPSLAFPSRYRSVQSCDDGILQARPVKLEISPSAGQRQIDTLHMATGHPNGTPAESIGACVRPNGECKRQNNEKCCVIEGKGVMAEIEPSLPTPHMKTPVGLSSYGAPGRIRTSDHLVRSQILYPTELRARVNGDCNRGHLASAMYGGERGIRTLDGAINPILP